MTKRVVYLIPGLATDERSYSFFKLGDDEEIRHIRWIAHKKNDTLASYAERLIPQIDLSRPVILIGTSLGGMLAVEIAKRIHPIKLILISSIPTRLEQPDYFKFFRIFPLYKWIPNVIFKNPGIWFKFLFKSRKLPVSWQNLFSDMFTAHSPNFIKWCMYAVLHWDNEQMPDNLIRYHGDVDHVFPLKRMRNFIRISRGSHLMVFTRGKEISTYIQQELNLQK